MLSRIVRGVRWAGGDVFHSVGCGTTPGWPDTFLYRALCVFLRALGMDEWTATYLQVVVDTIYRLVDLLFDVTADV